LCCGPCRRQALGRVGTSALSWKESKPGRRASSSLFAWRGRKPANEKVNWLLHLNELQKIKKSSCTSSYSLPRWLISATEGGEMREDKQASGLPDYSLTRECKTL